MSFRFLNDIICSTQVLTFSVVQFYFFSCLLCFWYCILRNSRKWRFIPMFPSKIFIVLALGSRSLVHLELIFYMVWDGVHLHSFGGGYAVVPVSFDKKTILPPIEWCWHTCQKLDNRRFVGLWILGAFPVIYMSVLMPKPHRRL